MKKPPKHTIQTSDKSGKTTNKPDSPSSSDPRLASTSRQNKKDAKNNTDSTDVSTTPTKTPEKKHQDTESSRSTSSRKEFQVAQKHQANNSVQTPSQKDKASAPSPDANPAQKPLQATNSKANAAPSQTDPNSSHITVDVTENTVSNIVPETFMSKIPVAPQPSEPLEETTEQQQPDEIQHQYVPPPLENKYLNKEALRNRLLLCQAFKPLIAYIGRLDSQKGVHLIRHGLFYALQNNAQFVLLGISPDPRINDEFWFLKHHLNENPDCHLELGFNEELSHLIYAGADMIIMPSLYEPCGLAQMIALKYGTVPIVRAVGGLVDTVFDRDYSDRPPHDRNGYVFHEPDAMGLESAMSRAIGLWYDYPEEFRQLMINGMKYDYSWNFPGQHYVNIYEYIRFK